MEIKSVTDLYFVFAVFVPGFIMLSVRSQFIVSSGAEKESLLLKYLIATSFNYAFSSWLIYLLAYNSYLRSNLTLSAVSWLYVLFVSPIILAVISAVISQKSIVRWLLLKTGLDVIHVVPTAWDWRFGRMRSPRWVLVRLSDGSKVAGYFGLLSMASSERDARDLFIEKVYKIKNRGPWTEVPGNDGVYIPHGEIRTIEFWPTS